jgi:pimeloyl-ACP methyl ester carboxylesterase
MYREWGDGPPLVIVPGLAGGIELLGPLARLLSRSFRVIGFPLRGEDDCFALRQRFGLADLADDLAEFLDGHGLEQPAVLGVSFGGVVALEFAVRYPQRLGSLAVQGTGAWFENGLVHRLASTVLSQYPLPPDNPFVNQFFNLLFGGAQQSTLLSEFVSRHWWDTDQSVMAHRLRLVEKFDLHGQLERIDLPTLVMIGTRDVLVSQRSWQALCRELPQTQRVTLNGGGHLAFLTQAHQVARALGDFLGVAGTEEAPVH